MRLAACNDDHAAAFFLLLGGLLHVLGQAAGIAALAGLARWRAQPFNQAIGNSTEMHFGQRLATGRINRCLHFRQVLAQFFGILRRAPYRHLHQAGQARQAQRVGRHEFAFKNGGHQTRLIVHQHELGIIGVKQHGWFLKKIVLINTQDAAKTAGGALNFSQRLAACCTDCRACRQQGLVRTLFERTFYY